MSGSRGRGRGRGRGSVSDDDDDPPSFRAPAPPSTSLRAATPIGTLGGQPVAGTSTAAANLFRKNDYTGASTKNGAGPVKMKFMPKMDKANKAPVVKKEPVDVDIKPIIGRGRGQGVRREQTASGAFSAGPAVNPRASGSRSGGTGGGSGGGSGGGGGGSGGGGGGKSGGDSGSYSSNKPEAGSGLAPDVQDLGSDSDDFDADGDIEHYADAMDVDDEGNELAPTMHRKAKNAANQASVLLDRIHLDTSVLAPLNLPRPPRSTEDARKEAERREAEKRLKEAEATGGIVEVPAPPPPIISHETQLRQKMAAEFLESKDGQALHVFQFPRTFPEFRRPGADDTKDDVKPDVKPGKPVREPQNAQEYLAGGWEGFGKRATTKGRPMPGGSGKPSGQIGVIQVLEGGKVRMVLGADPDNPDMVYDILPAAQPEFLQELAVVIPKESNLFTPPVKQEDGVDEQKMASTLAPPSMLIMGPVERKYIVRPDIKMLLDQMAATDEDRRLAEERRVEEEARVKKEQEHDKALKKINTAAKPKASGSGSGVRAPVKKKATAAPS